MESEEREDIIRAKKALSPNGLENQSAEGQSGVSSEVFAADLPTNELPTEDLEDKCVDGPGENGETFG